MVEELKTQIELSKPISKSPINTDEEHVGEMRKASIPIHSSVEDTNTSIDLKTVDGIRTHSVSPEAEALSELQPSTALDPERIYQNKDKYHKLCKDFRFFGRTLTLILLLLLFTLSITYCFGQRLSVTLELIKRCEPKQNAEIWHHSYLSSLRYGVINAESQHGITSEPCWTTDSFDISTDQLWLSNKYMYQWEEEYSLYFVFFVFLAFYCIIIIIYDISTLIVDIYYVYHNMLHRKCKLYQKQDTGEHSSISSPTFWNKYMSNDQIGWIIRSLINEITELMLQTQALLLYNGYHVFDRYNEEDIYLAHKPQYIILFAIILAMNAFGSGVLWLLYTFSPNTCYGTMFKLFVFVIDGFSDLFYTIFPLIVIFSDGYNEGTDNIYVSLGQLNIDSGLAFCAAFIPLFLLCTKSLIIIRSTTNELREAYYKEWKRKQSAIEVTNHNNWIHVDKGTKKGKIKQMILSLIALSFIGFGVSVIALVTNHMSHTNAYCTAIRETNYIQNGTVSVTEEELVVFERNPELFFWDKCLYQIYPFTSKEHLQCQCRVAVIDWQVLESSTAQRKVLNLTQDKILSGILSNWIMLEKFRTNNAEEGRMFKDRFSFPNTSLSKMKAFEWSTVGIESLESGISTWTDLEYLQFKNTPGSLAKLPADFDELRNMKYLSFIDSGLQEFPSSICNMNQLQVLQMEFEAVIESIPHCIGTLDQLQVLLVDGSFQLSDIPVSMFNLPNLRLLSVTTASIDYHSLLRYNLPDDIHINDTESINEWFEDNFRYKDTDSDTEYWLSQNPICDDLEDDFIVYPSKLQTFLTDSCDYYCSTNATLSAAKNAQFCFPRLMGNGRCDEYCNTLDCNWDDGDCMQLCFAPQLTNCSKQDWNFEDCDEKCDNWYCAGYTFGGAFLSPLFSSCRCDYDTCRAKDVVKATNCSTASWIEDIQLFKGSDYCGSNWIGDGICDDLCNIEECLHDAGDCDGGCIGDMCNTIYQAWLFLGGAEVHKVDHSTACAEIWPTAIAISVIGDNLVDTNCSETLSDVDYNNDKHINFREFTSLGYWLFGGNEKRGAQVNCSQCIGMEYYNV